MRRFLKMHASQRAALVVERQVALCQRRVDAALGEFLGPPRHRKEAALIVDRCDVDHPRARDARRSELHYSRNTFLRVTPLRALRVSTSSGNRVTIEW